MVYDLPVIEEKVKPHQITTLHMVCALSYIVAGTIIVIYNYVIPVWGAVVLSAGLLLTFLVMAKNKWVISPSINPIFRIVELLIAVSLSLYSFTQHWKFPTGIFAVLAMVIVFALFLERSSGDPLAVHIDDEGVKLPSAVRGRFRPWTEIEEVLFRFGTLTINFTDNSYIQWDLIEPKLDQQMFEQYCSTRIEENRSKRRSDDW